tara:strand:- start:94 stop:867 length:774 start_codon:yes stop_codon:yes gene_type:complete
METIRFEAADGIGTLTLNRPDRMNGMTTGMLVETHDCLQDVAGRSDVRVVVLTGEGRGFCPGADLKARVAGETAVPAESHHYNVPVLLHDMPQVTVAAINGACAGAGLGWALACDLRFATRPATFSSAFLKVAVAGDMGGPWTLSRLVGAAKARELYFLPEKFHADEAQAMGLISRVFDDEVFREEISAVAKRLASSSPGALATMKQNFLDAERLDLADYVAVETKRHQERMRHEDVAEAFAAFVEKREPKFKSLEG